MSDVNFGLSGEGGQPFPVLVVWDGSSGLHFLSGTVIAPSVELARRATERLALAHRAEQPDRIHVYSLEQWWELIQDEPEHD